MRGPSREDQKTGSFIFSGTFASTNVAAVRDKPLTSMAAMGSCTTCIAQLDPRTHGSERAEIFVAMLLSRFGLLFLCGLLVGGDVIIEDLHSYCVFLLFPEFPSDIA